jgi:membrane protease YdiL (CAAX protease family)
VVLVVAVLCLILQYYIGDRDTFYRWFPRPPGVPFVKSYYELESFGWWTAWSVGGYVVIPLVVVLLLPGEHLRDYGFSLRGFRQHAWIYVVLFLLVLPFVVGVSFTTPFQRQYPFYKLANRSTFDFVSWEILYSLQFLSLEFFFRGFLLHGLKRSIGAHAIWVMIVPYVMIHFEKPLPETLGAILAGLALGTLALRTRSIWCGVLIHMSVAITMDLLALSHCPVDQPCRSERPSVYEQQHYGAQPR